MFDVRERCSCADVSFSLESGVGLGGCVGRAVSVFSPLLICDLLLVLVGMFGSGRPFFPSSSFLNKCPKIILTMTLQLMFPRINRNKHRWVNYSQDTATDR